MIDAFFHPIPGNQKKMHVHRDRTFDWNDAISSHEVVSLSHDDQAFLGFGIKPKKMIWCAITIIVFFSVLILKTVHLQIFHGAQYIALANQNRIRVEKIVPQRGLIFDRNGVPLVRNVPKFAIGLVPLDLPDDEIKRSEVLRKLSRLLTLPLVEIVDLIDQAGSNYPNPIILKESISYEDSIKLEIASASLPGVKVDVSYQREYLHPTSPRMQNDSKVTQSPDISLGHILGYMGRMTKKEYTQKQGENYLFRDTRGETGIEQSHEDILRGKLGKKKIEVDALGAEKIIISKVEPIDGQNISLTLDLNVQHYLERLIQEALEKFHLKRAAAVVLDPNTGAIIALISAPSFDNNLFSNGISIREYNTLESDPNNPLFNRVIAGTYPSGSTIKPIVAAAGLNEKIVTAQTSIFSSGGIRIQDWFFPDWKTSGHGATNISSALAWSVNTYFYYIGGGFQNFKGLGIEGLTDYYKKFGVGSKLGIDLPGEKTGFLPSRAWKEETKGERWYIGDTYHLAIGQGDLLVTPLQVAAWTMYFANGGTIFQPTLLGSHTDTLSNTITYRTPHTVNKDIVDPKNTEIVRQGLRNAVLWGSAQKLQSVPVTVAAKTGTAQWHSEKAPHSWLTAFAPYDNSELVVTVLIEEGGEGGGLATEITRDFLEWYFGKYSKKQQLSE